MLQCVAVCCRVLQCVAVCYSERYLPNDAFFAYAYTYEYIVLQCVAVCCNVLRCVIVKGTCRMMHFLRMHIHMNS